QCSGLRTRPQSTRAQLRPAMAPPSAARRYDKRTSAREARRLSHAAPPGDRKDPRVLAHSLDHGLTTVVRARPGDVDQDGEGVLQVLPLLAQPVAGMI